jgi:hypothetical protein
MRRTTLMISGLALLAACGQSEARIGEEDLLDEGANAINTAGYRPLNLAAGSMVVYEAQVRTANACRTDVGAPWQREACAKKVAPVVRYDAEGMSCGALADLEKIKLGTFDDMLENTNSFKEGITLRYINEKVGANTVWIMPPFPNNQTWSIPDACDNLGSPYAVRDYFHSSGMASRRCINQGRSDTSAEPCWSNAEFEALIAQAHAKGMKVMLDVAFNHFGHNYLMYDYGEYRPVRERIAAREDLNGLWNLSGTRDDGLLRPEILDTPAKLTALANSNPSIKQTLTSLRAKCPNLTGDLLVRSFNLWREAFDWERESFDCNAGTLERNAPGFYLGQNRFDPATRLGDSFTNNWRDVKFLFHREENAAKQWQFVRTREYLFRIMNYWTSRGVDAFRLDHTTDPDNGLGSNEWTYITNKVDYYASLRGQARPVYMAEEFHEQMEMNKVVDAMTEGYVGDMNGRGGKTKNTSMVEGVLRSMERFNGRTFTMTALETHDEHRLVDGTGFNMWTGAGFWGIGATTRSMPMIVMGQEFGESWGIGFRRSDFLRARFEGTGNYQPSGEALTDFYRKMNVARLAPENRALLAPNNYFLRSRWTNAADQRIFAQVKWSNDANVIFVFHNLWEQNVENAYYLPPGLANALQIRDGFQYRLRDVLSGNQMGPCRSGAELKWELYVKMDAGTRLQWARLEVCN